MYILNIDMIFIYLYHLSFPLAFPGRLPPWRVIWFRSPRVHKDQQVRLERQVLCGAQEMARNRSDAGVSPRILGEFCLLQFEHMQHIFQVGNQIGYLHLVALGCF